MAPRQMKMPTKKDLKRGWFWAGCGRTSAGLYLVMIGIAPSTGGDALKIAIDSLIALAVIGYVIVKDDDGHALAYTYYENELGRRSVANLLTRDEARRIAITSPSCPSC